MPRWFGSAPNVEQQLQDLVDIARALEPGTVTRAAQRRDQRRKPIVHRRFGIGADLEQRADERERAVVDRVDEARADRVGIWPFGIAPRIIDRRAQGIEIALEEGVVDLTLVQGVQGCRGS